MATTTALAAMLVGIAIATAAGPAQAATITVTNTSDVNAGSLRRAIETAEQQPYPDTIKFNIPGAGPHTITLLSDLPVLSYPVKIQGYSQPGASVATSTEPAEPMIVIDASNAFRGLDIGGDGIEIRGLVIHSAQDVGIFVEGERNTIAGNHIGTDAAGTAALMSATNGVEIYGADNVIGGPDVKDRNVIAGNNVVQVRVSGGSGHAIQGNRIGTDATGTADLGNTSTGVLMVSSGNTLRDNLISGAFVGVEVWGDDSILQGNLVGTNAEGDAPIGNGLGVNIEGGDRNQIGGFRAGEGNVLSGNEYGGLQLETGLDGPAEDNDVMGNLIGTNAAGTTPIPNGVGFGLPGVSIHGSNDNRIGGRKPGAGNVIAGNEGDGVVIHVAGADDNRVVGNMIGTNLSGALGLGNGGSGVRITGVDRNSVGDTDPSFPMNTIAYNGGDGVTVEDSAGTDNMIVRNRIFANGGLGIDLGANGVTLNDALDADVGANDRLNFPEIDAATTVGGVTTIDWRISAGLPGTRFRVDFYANDTCDNSGNGEGQTFLGSAFVMTNAAGDAVSSTPMPTVAAAGQSVTATATVAPTVLAPNPEATSEFSPCETVI